MEGFARTAAAIAARPGKLDKVELLAAYFRSLGDEDLASAARFFSGKPFGAREQLTLSLGGRAIVRVARRLWEFDDAALSAAYRASGDLGSALGALARPPRDAMLLHETPTPAWLSQRLREIAAAGGKHAAVRRENLLERILRAASEPAIAAYTVKVITGELRIGLREGFVLDAIATAFHAGAASVRHAARACGDVGEVALAAKHGNLDAIHVAYGAAIGFMLASPIPYGDAYPALRGHTWHLEDKYDGIRAQAHVGDGRVRLFSRTLNDVTASYPEIAQALRGTERNAIFDGEIVAMRGGRALPFRLLQARLQRKSVDEALLAEIPLVYAVFDLLALGDDLLIEEPLRDRRTRLEQILPSSERLVPAPYAVLRDGGAALVNEAFAAARERGNEGLVLKRSDSPYAPGRRGKWWLKLKRELATLDVVVVAVEWGHGKRAQVLSDYTFAVAGPGGAPLAIGKAFSGLTDAEIAELTPWFLGHRLPPERKRPKARSHEIPVEPKIVLEVAFDVVQESDLHESGFALRFPRIVRIRDDKPPDRIDTLERVRELYRESSLVKT
ncbi:MAG TPA: ATP-dependent DNA ligase [Verrucomicrobiae bacterium]|nr:ATP-dependent DNA ligase [Verrucomicrobiae bacterium]